MMTVADRTSVTREIDSLIDQQIQTLRQHYAISEPELKAHRDRSQRIRSLCRNLRPEGSPNWMSEELAGDLLVNHSPKTRIRRVRPPAFDQTVLLSVL